MSVRISGRILPSGGVGLRGISADIVGEQTFTTIGANSFVVPAGVTSISAVCIGGGGAGFFYTGSTINGKGGSGGALAYVNNISVTPGETLTVNVGTYGNVSAGALFGGISDLTRDGTPLVRAGGGLGGNSTPNTPGSVLVGTGGAGGLGGTAKPNDATNTRNAGGGGAGGYSGAGGAGGTFTSLLVVGQSGTGGAGGGGGYSSTNALKGNGGGGTGLLGTGTNGAGGASNTAGTGGSGGNNGSTGSSPRGGDYGAGGGGALNNTAFNGGRGGQGAVRIMWGSGRSFPSNAASV